MSCLLLTDSGPPLLASSGLVQVWVTGCPKCWRGWSSVEAWYSTSLEIALSLAVVVDTHVHVFVADVVKLFDAVNKRILDCWCACMVWACVF